MPVRPLCAKPIIATADATNATVASFDTFASRRTNLSSIDPSSSSTSPSLASYIRRRCRPQTPMEDDGTLSLSSLMSNFSFWKGSKPNFDDGFIVVTSKKNGSESERCPDNKFVFVDHSQEARNTSGKAVLKQHRIATTRESWDRRLKQAPTVPQCKEDEAIALGERTSGHLTRSENSQTSARSPLRPSCWEEEALVPPENKSSFPASPTLTCFQPRQAEFPPADVSDPHFLHADADDATMSSSASWITPVPTPEERKREQLALARRKILHQQRSALRQQKERLSKTMLNSNSPSTAEPQHGDAFTHKNYFGGQKEKRCKQGNKVGCLGSFLERGGVPSAGGGAVDVEVEEERISKDDLLSVFQWSTGLAARTQPRTEDNSIQTVPEWRPHKDTSTITRDTFINCRKAQPRSSDARGYKADFRCDQASNNLTVKNNSASVASVSGGRIACRGNHNGSQSVESSHSFKSVPKGGYCVTPVGRGIIFPARPTKASSAKKPQTASAGPYRSKPLTNRVKQSRESLLGRTAPKCSDSIQAEPSASDAVVTTSGHWPPLVTSSNPPSMVLCNDVQDIPAVKKPISSKSIQKKPLRKYSSAVAA